LAAIDETTSLPAGPVARLKAAFAGGTSEASVTRRLAGTIFVIRVISAAFAYLSQILLARWMGGSDYGIYVYVWTWVLLLGSLMDFGISASAQKIIPEYRTRGEGALLRGFLAGSRWMTFVVSAAVSVLLAAVVKLLSPWIEAGAIVPLYIGCLTLPAFVVANTQDGIARSHDWMQLGLMPQFIVRQALIIGITAGFFVLGFQLGATAAMVASAVASLPAMPRLLQWTCSGCGTPSACVARCSALTISRDETPYCGTRSSNENWRTFAFRASEPPALTTLTPSERVASSVQAT